MFLLVCKMAAKFNRDHLSFVGHGKACVLRTGTSTTISSTVLDSLQLSALLPYTVSTTSSHFPAHRRHRHTSFECGATTVIHGAGWFIGGRNACRERR